MSSPSRRELLAAVAAVGVGNVAFQRAVVAAAAQPKVEAVTAEMVKNAEWIAGITLTDDERRNVAGAMTRVLRSVATFNKLELGNAVPPAIGFNAAPWEAPAKEGRGKVELPANPQAAKKPEKDDDLAFLPLTCSRSWFARSRSPPSN